MSQREVYTVQIAGLTRHLPLFEVAPGVRIAVFNMLGDTEIVQAGARALAKLLEGVAADVIVTPEAKSIPLAYELSVVTGLPYVVLRKTRKGYMGETISAETVSITTGRKQTLFLDEKDIPLVRSGKTLLVDDVVSTGSTLEAMLQIVDSAGGEVSKIVAVFTEGDQDWSRVIALGNLPVFTD